MWEWLEEDWFDWLEENFKSYTQQNNWIKVEDRLPEDDTFHILRIQRNEKFHIIKAAYIGNGLWQEDDKKDTKWSNNSDYTPTHWMTLPTPPNE